ncbi:MAG TPA: 1-acyl-sn-glycerol-3-phosphate acyltransferase [Anaerolineales bacterium]|nr:1-acyl-sn-glycerol-3-phosphate acyltransferase [Anaerolineales bacterium]
MNIPKYSYPRGLFAKVARDIVLLRRRDFHQDAKACIEHLRPPMWVLGKENIPQHGPCVLTVNHYYRLGFGAQWLTLAIAGVVPEQMHWIMTAEWTNSGKWYRTLGAIGSRILLSRTAYVYGFTNMPPMPPRPGDMEARAAAVRAVLRYVKRAKDPIIGLAPEGYDPPEGVLTRPPAGAGRFALLLARAGLKLIPVGAYEADGKFHIHFGERYELKVPGELSSDEKDERAARIIMEKIACLLPSHLRGEFA